MSTPTATVTLGAEEQALLTGDLKALSAEQRGDLYNQGPSPMSAQEIDDLLRILREGGIRCTNLPESERRCRLADPVPGMVMHPRDLGRTGSPLLVYVPCIRCGTPRWVARVRPTLRCRGCANREQQRTYAARPEQSARQRGAGNPMYKGGRTGAGKHGRYIYVLVSPDDALASMANKDGYAMEHRLVMARSLGRPLHRWEQVHHLNGDRQDNRLENLEIWRLAHPAGVRPKDYHCPGCRCFEHGDAS
jgi:hypothetical protein